MGVKCMSDITYQGDPGITPMRVYLLDKLIGHIKEVRNGSHFLGYAYYPKGSRTPGEIFETVRMVQDTLEEI